MWTLSGFADEIDPDLESSATFSTTSGSNTWSSAVVRRLGVLARKAQDAGLILLHENEKEIYGDIPGRVLDIVESVDRPSVKLAWDRAT